MLRASRFDAPGPSRRLSTTLVDVVDVRFACDRWKPVSFVVRKGIVVQSKGKAFPSMRRIERERGGSKQDDDQAMEVDDDEAREEEDDSRAKMDGSGAWNDSEKRRTT